MFKRLMTKIGGRADAGPALFDKDFYLSTYRDVAAAGADPLAHFMTHGWREGRNPSAGFHTLYYRDRNPSCGRDENPLAHYEANKDRLELFVLPRSEEELIELQKRVVESQFDEDFYRMKYLGGDPQIEALDHYIRTGWSLGFDPSTDFSTRRYLEANPHIVFAKVSPLYHHVTTDPRSSAPAPQGGISAALPAASREEAIAAIAPEFDAKFYLCVYTDVATAKVDPLTHFVDHGWKEGRDPNAVFWTRYYLSHNEDVRASGLNPFYHYIIRGRAEGRAPNPVGAALWPRPLAPSEEEWSRAAPAKDVANADVDIVIPVYQGYDDTLASIYAVLANAQQARFALVVVNDRSPDSRLTEELRRLHARGLFDYLENEQNLGFVRTVNRALALHPDRDVIILNADAIVHGDWIDRLLAHARRDEKIATITPFSNNATICSYPKPNQNNVLALESTLAELDDHAKICNAGMSTMVPTGVGFCMYMRRAVIDAVGDFDAEAFGRGYGEECDFCLRALKAGYVNIFAHDVFVYHTGQISFADYAGAAVTASQVTLRGKHPDYPMRVSLYVRHDPAQEARLRLDLYRLAQRLGSRTAVMVTHSIRGGVATHVQDLMRRLRDEDVAVVAMKVGTSGADDLLISVDDDLAVYTPSLGALSIARHARLIEDFLSWLKPEILHVHSFVGLDWSATLSLMSIIERAAPGFYCTLHDYTALCHRHHLVTPEGDYCADRRVETCRVCAHTDKSHAFLVDPAEREQRYGAFYEKAARVFTPSQDAAERLARVYPNVRAKVRPHEDVPPAFAEPQQPPPPEEKLRVAIIGAIGLHKGARLLHALAIDAAARALPISYRIIGFSGLRKELEAQGVEETGRYGSDDLALARLADWRPHLAFFPSIWPETFCYTLSLSLAAGVPPVVFDLGAPAERLRELDQGQILDLALAGTPAALNDALLALPLDALWKKRKPFAPRSYARLVEDYYGRM
jgi:GT2 family glycosyltransferase/glycosyltransferase involved in cell wall biosynthesis